MRRVLSSSSGTCASLKMFFLRSMMESVPSAFHRPMSPVCSQPSAVSASAVASGFLWYLRGGGGEGGG
jgi:hypothetical protein